MLEQGAIDRWDSGAIGGGRNSSTSDEAVHSSFFFPLRIPTFVFSPYFPVTEIPTEELGMIF
jgi:hypothetical protein